jgi:oligoribonuclease
VNAGRPRRNLARVLIDRLVWIDCEMTGLDLATDRLIEVAVVVTDGELEVLDEGLDLVIGADEQALAGMRDVVAQMHASSGLTEAVRAATLTVGEAEQQVLQYVQRHVPERRKAPLCGNSIGTDRGFLARDMPLLDDWLHYRMIDVSSIKELARRWYPKTYFDAPKKAGGHRALADILESVAELRYYRSTVFVPPPGSDEVARSAAAQAAVRAPAALQTPD